MSQFDEGCATLRVVRAARSGCCWMVLALAALTGSVSAQTITKTAPTEVDAGASLSYSISVNNNTGAALADVVVIDTFPNQVTYTGATAPGWTCTQLAGLPVQVECAADAALPTGNSSFTLQATAGAPISDTATTNSVSLEVASTQEDTDTANTTIRAVADLNLDKSIVDGANRVDSASVRGGDGLSFAVSVSNAGPSAAQNVQVRDSLPAGFTFDSSQSDFGSPDWSCASNVGLDQVTCDYTPNLASGATAPELLIDVIAPATAGNFNNTANGESDADDTAFPHASDTVSVEVFLEADLRVTKTAGSATAYSGQPISYTYTITNHGPQPATNIQLSDVFDRANVLGSISITAGAPNWSCAANPTPPASSSQLDCSYNSSLSLAPDNGTTSLVLTVEITAPTVETAITLGNQATVSSAESLPTPANNVSGAVQVTVEPSADLSVTPRTAPVAAQDADSVFVYNVAIANAGPSTAQAVTLSDSVPAGSLLQSVSGSGWTCQINQLLGSFECMRASLASGASASVAVSTRLPRNPPTPGQASGDIASGTATVSSSTHDPAAANNSDAPFDLTIAADWDLAISKTASQAVVVPGQSFTYEIAIDNFGPSDLTGDIRALLSDDFDANLRGGLDVCGVSATVPCWQCESPNQPFFLSELDSDDAALTGIGGGRQLVVSPSREFVFVAGQFDNAVAVLDRSTARSAAFGALAYASFATDATAPRSVAVHPGGAWLVTAEQGSSGRLLRQTINPSTGALGTATTLASNLNEVEDLRFNPQGDVLYVAESGADSIRVYSFDAASGAIAAVATVSRDAVAANPVLLGGVTRLALSPNGNHLYAAAPDDHAIVAFSVNASTGSLTPLSTASTAPLVGGESVPFAALAVGTDGDELYAGGGSRVLVFDLTAATGLLGTFEATSATSLPARLLDGVSDLVVAPDGNSFYVAATTDQAVSRFARDELGAMVFERSEPLADAMQANALAIDSAGETLYVAASSQDVSGVVAPDRSKVITYRLAGPGQCDGIRPGELDTGDIVDRALTVPAGQRLTVVVDAGLNAGLSITELNNVATLEDADGATISDNALIEVRNATEVVVTKTAPDQRPIPGTEFAYTIEIENLGPGGLVDLEISDQPPVFGGVNVAGFIGTSFEWQCEAEGNACCTHNGTPGQCGQIQPTGWTSGTLVGHGVDMPSNSRLVFTLRGDLHPSSEPGASLSNTATLTMPAGISPFDPADLSSTHTVNIDAQTDLWLIKESLGVTDQAGTPVIEYRVRVGNSGPSAAAGLTVEDVFDPLVFDPAASSWSCTITDAGEALSQSCCSYGLGACQATNLTGQSGPISQTMALASGAEAQFSMFVPVIDPGAAAVENEASVSVPPLVTDPDPTNNTDTALVRLLATADLDISKEILAGSSVTPGEEVSFIVTLQSEGPDDVPVIVQDLLPPELDNVTWTCDATTPTPGDLSYENHYGLGADLVEPVAVLTSEDGRHVYMLGAGGEFTPGAEPSPASLAAYERNIIPGPNFGELTLIDLEVDGVNDDDDSGLTVEALADARGMAMSPDQRYIYVATGSPGAVVVFRRDALAGSPQFGQLSFVEARLNGSDQPGDQITPVSGLGGATAVRVSRDGSHVYVASREEHAVATFRRDPGTGVLSFQGRISAPTLLGQGTFALWGALAVDIPPEDDFVYVTGRGPVAAFSGPNWSTTDTRAAVGTRSYFVPNTPGIALKWLQLEQGVNVADASDLRLSFQHIYSLDWATSCYDAGVLEISTDGGQNWLDVLDAGGVFVTGGYTENQNGGEQNPLNGRPGWCRNSPGWTTGSFNDVEVDLSGAVADGESVLIRFGLGEGTGLGNPGWWIDDIRLYNDATPGTPLLLDTAAGGSGGATITVLARNDDDTALGYGDLEVDSVVALPSTVDVATMDGVGQTLYVGSAADESISVYGRDADTGALGLTEVVTLTASIDPPISGDSLAGLAAMAVSPDGEHLIVSGAAVDRLVVFRRLPFVGTLRPMQELELGAPADQPVEGGIEGVQGIVVSSDGQQVFTAASVGQLGVFARRAPDPTFGFLEAVVDGEDDGFGATASGLLGARAAAVSENGLYVFAASFGQIASSQSGALVVLERDAGATEPGRHLRFRQVLRNNQAGVTGLDGALDVKVYDNDIYVAAERSNAVTHFRQDPGTGVVSFIGSYANGGSISGLSGAAALEISPGGEHVYVAGRFDHAVAIFARDALNGTLSFVGEARNGIDGVIGMLGANALAISTDGQQLYVAARQSNAVVVLDRVGDTLVHRQSFFDGTEGAVLTSPTGITVSREVAGSEHVLVTSLDADAVTVLKRLTDPTQPDLRGRVRFQQSLVNGVDGVDALLSPRDIIVDPDNDRVYVASDDGDALVIFDRNVSPGGALFGSLAPLEVRRLGVRGVIGLDRPYGLAVTRGARRNIYAASLGGQSVTAFVRRSGSSCPAAGSGNLSEPVFIAAGGTVRFTITGTINPGAEGFLDNLATLVIPSDVNNTGNSSDPSDSTEMIPSSALVVEKTNSRLSVVAGEQQSYRITIGNDGPSHARNVGITDLLSANSQFDVASAAWTCTAVGTGLLDRQETLSEAMTDQAGLLGSAGVVWTPAPHPLLDERVYVAGVLGDGLAVFSIDPVSGELVAEPGLSLVEGGIDGAGNPVSGLRGARAIATAFGGSQLYLASQVDNSISVINVNTDDSSPAFGTLSIVQTIDDGLVGLSAFDQPTDVVVSADGLNVYVAAANSNAIYVFDRIVGTGNLVPTPAQVLQSDGTVLLDGVSDLTMGPEGDHLYAAGSNSASIAVFERNGDGSLTPIQTRSSPATPGLAGVTALRFGPGGAQLYAVARDDESILVFNRDNDPLSAQFGRLLSGVAQRIERSDVSEMISPRDLLISPDGGSAYLSAFGRNALLVFARDRETGRLSYRTRYVDGDDEVGLAGVSALALSPNGSELLAGALLDNSITRFVLSGFSRCELDAGTGDVDLLADIAAGGQIIIDLDVEVAAGTLGSVCPAPLDPERNCVVNEVEVSLTQGGTTTIQSASDASFLDRAANLVVTKSDGLAEFRGLSGAAAIDGTDLLGSHLYVAAPGEPGIGVFAIEEVIGSPTGDYPLRFVEALISGEDGVSQLNGVNDVLVSPDGRHVYASSALDSALVAFEREPFTGRLSVLAVYRNNNAGVSGLSGPRAMAMDSDGRHLYVAAANSNSLVVFSRQNDEREPGFGELSWQASVQNGTDGVQDLLTPVHLAMSPDGRHVYVAAQGSDAVVTFRRQADEEESAFGGLTWIQSRRNLLGNVVGLLDVSRVLVSPDGEFLYAAGTGNNAVVVFDRVSSAVESNFGRLSFLEAAVDGSNGFEGLAAVSDLTPVGAGAAFIAASSPTDNTVALLSRDAATGLLSFSSLIEEGEVQNPPGGAVVVDGLVGASALFALPGDNRFYAGSREPGAIVALDESSGLMDFAGSVIQGGGGAVPGASVEYLIQIHNEGPSRVADARVTDIFPADFDAVSWTCTFGSAESSCPGTGTGNIDVLVDLDAGDTMSFFATGQLRSDASGFVVNRASATMPAGVVDLDPASSEATDDNTIVRSSSNLEVSIEGLPAALVAGADLDYQVRVRNLGPSDASGARVEHRLPEALGRTAWVCEADREPGTLTLQPAPVQVLADTRASAISRDGRHVYVTGDTSVPVLAVYDRNTLTGELTPKQLIENLSIEPDPDGDRLIDGLAGARELAVSSDDRFLYVLGYQDDAISVFERDLATGRLTFLQVLRDNIGVIDGLGGPVALAFDSAEAQVYVAGQLDNAIAVFDRNASTGELSFLQFLRDGQAGVENLNAPADLLVADADATVLVASAGSDALVRFDRAGNGQLSYAGSLVQGDVIENGAESLIVDGLSGVRSMVLSEDERWLYTYGRSGLDQAIAVFERASAEQSLPVRVLREGDAVGVPPLPIGGLVGATELVLTADGQQLYLSGLDDLQGSRSLAAFRILEGADLQFLGRFDGAAASAPGQGHHLSVSSDGRHLYSVGAGFDNVDVWQLLGGSICGRAGEVLVLDQVDLEAGGEVLYDISTSVLANARGTVDLEARIDPVLAREDSDLSNNVASLSIGIIAEAALEVIKTRQTDPIVAGEPVVWDIVINNHGPSSLLGVDVIDALPALPGEIANPMAPGVVSGSAQWVCSGEDHLFTSQSFGGAELAAARGVSFSPDGLWAAATGQAGDSVILYQRNPSTGALSAVDAVSDGDPIFDEDDVQVGTVIGLDGAADVAFSPDQAHLVVASAEADALVVFALDADAGSLVFVEALFNGEGPEGQTGTVFDLDEPVRIRFAPDGERLFVAARSSNALTVFGRQAVTGRLNWLESWGSGLNGLPVNAMDGVSDLVVSPDGAYVYAAATQNNSIGIFRRDESGNLAWDQRLANGQIQNGVSVVGLGLVQSLAISPKGRQLYAASLSEDSVTLFARDPQTGLISFVEQYRDGVEGVQGLDGANSVAVSPDGENVLVGARNDSNIVVFARDWVGGELREIEVLDGAGLTGPRRMAIAPDGGSVLLTTEEGSGTLLNLRRQAEGYCGLDSSLADELFDTVDLAAGGSLSYQVEALVHPGARGILENTATVVEPPATGALTPMDQSDTDSGPITVVTDVGVDKTIDGEASSLIGGGLVRFVLEVTNDGPSHAFAARLEDLLPASIVASDWTCQVIPVGTGQSQCPSSGTGSLDETVDVVAGERLLVIIDGQIASDFLGQLSNTATITEPGDASDPDGDNNSSTVTATVSAVADIVVGKFADVLQLTAGEMALFVVDVTNLGPSDAPSVSIVDSIAPEFLDPQWTCTASGGAVCPSPNGMGDIMETGPLPSGGGWRFEIEAQVDPFLAVPQVLSNGAQATLNGSEVNDPDVANNEDSAEVAVVSSEADLSVSKTVDLGSALPGDPVNYQIVLDNAGPSGSIEARLVDLMPAELINVSWTCTAVGDAVCPEASGVGDIDLSLQLPPASGLIIDVQAQIDPATPSGPQETVVNTVTVQVVQGAEDPDPGNNEASASTVLDLDVIFSDRFETPASSQEEPEA
ncbi:beta-propeller fold lactonase family protein [Wenzhouxiangella marina]|uniref:DUF11 domain-containing protein n=1 Tax=Wenzhouxiangella marina TaxID=1579979 RepID=A0A0K0XXT0_9GAMM|nr:beta-propeller fold lactonase family protein [Wenzhouxiangella marina]AKS42488.1 hypothetical protein WM2015_2123 [Wenzhouxiangella marina]MBB6085737.1 putative repeat protein (TIGR01451 family) [Wenzhouxiangella marina]